MPTHALGQEGREFYQGRQLPLGFLYPGLFALMYSLLFAYLLQKIDLLQTPYLLLAYLPLVAGIADYCENIGILSLASSYPDIASTTVTIASNFTILKSVATSIYFVALFVLIIVFGITKSRKSR